MTKDTRTSLKNICNWEPPINLNLSEEALEVALAAETASGNQRAANSATLNARLAELDEALAAKRLTQAEHKRLRARLLAQF